MSLGVSAGPVPRRAGRVVSLAAPRCGRTRRRARRVLGTRCGVSRPYSSR